MKSYLVCINQSCLDIIKIYKKMKLSSDQVSLAFGLAWRWFSLGRWSSVSHAEGVRRAAVPVQMKGGPVMVVPLRY